MFGARRVARRSARRLGRHIAYRGAASPVPPTGAVPEPDGPPAFPVYATELRQLADLKDRGIISQVEFDAKKKQILGL